MFLVGMRMKRYFYSSLLVLVAAGWVVSLIYLPFTLLMRILFASSSLLVIELLLFRLVLKPAMEWGDFKYSRAAIRQTGLHISLLAGSIIFMIPFAWLVVTSLKEDSQMSKFPPVWIPTQQVEWNIGGKKLKISTMTYNGQKVTVAITQALDDGMDKVEIVRPVTLNKISFIVDPSQMHSIRHFAPVWKNYSDALKFLPPESDRGLVFLSNTLEITLLSIIGTLLSSSMVAFGFARLRFPGRDVVFLLVLATMMLPAAVTMMPVFLIFRQLGWIDTLKPLWVPSFFGSAFNVFLLRQFFLGIPVELEDAAKIDGCSFYTIYWRIMLPQLKPALAALTIMTFMGAWNDFRGPLIYISSPSHEPLAYALQLFQSAHGGEPGMMMAASTMVMLPVLVLFFFTQRYFIQGITLTGIKG